MQNIPPKGYCRLENIRFEPGQNSFQYTGGRWRALHEAFPIDADNDLDIMIIITGNPGLHPTIKITIDNQPPVTHSTYQPIGVNGRAFFGLSIPV